MRRSSPFGLTFATILLLNLIVYAPSFFSLPRSDQWVYLANTQERHDWFSLAFTDYDREPGIYGGGKDWTLFRPAVFFILGTEKYFFGDNWALWQIPGFLLHLAVVWRLLRILRRVHDGPAAFLTALFFSIMPAGLEMVTWQHIQGYLLFLFLILTAFDKLQEALSRRTITSRELLTLQALLFGAALCYELGFVYALFFAVYARAGLPKSPDRNAKTAALCVPALLYLGLNLTDLLLRGFSLLQPLPSSGNLISKIAVALYAVGWWLYAGLFPGQLEFALQQRTTVAPPWAFRDGPFFVFNSIEAVVSILAGTVLAAAVVGILVRKDSRQLIKERAATITLLTAMLGVFIVVIVAGRTGSAPQISLGTNSYYNYYAWIFLVLIAYHAAAFKHLQLRWRTVVCAVAAALIILNVLVTIRATTAVAKRDIIVRTLMADINRLIGQHGSDQNFSFGVDEKLRPYVYLEWARKMDEPAGSNGHTCLELLYPRYYAERNPKYVYSVGENGGLIVRQWN